jgi:hypothetical protein
MAAQADTASEAKPKRLRLHEAPKTEAGFIPA